jgi:hypothetical protein
MALSKEQNKDIENVLKSSLRKKFQSYNPEPASMPFHTRLLGKDRLALFSFIHSLNTNFGTSIFEPVAITLAKANFNKAISHINAGEFISDEAQKVVQTIMGNLITAKSLPNKPEEIELIRAVCQKGKKQRVKPTKVDIFLESKKGEIYLIDLKTAKPNIGGFKEFKRTLLEWAAVILASDPKVVIHTLIAIPYNPYEPKPYNRWTIRGMLDLQNELKVAEEFWNFLGGEGSYEELLNCFERTGIELRAEIDKYFSKFK